MLGIVPDNVEFHGISITERSKLSNDTGLTTFTLKTIVLGKNYHSPEIKWLFDYSNKTLTSYNILHYFV
jgi:hypothetical protein